MLPDLRATLEQISKDKHTQFIDGMLNDIWSKKDLLLADFIHPNSKGYEKVAEKVYKFILPIINPAN